MWTRFLAPMTLVLLVPLLLGSARASDDETLAHRLRTTKVSVQIEEMPFAQVVDLLRAQTAINILIDPRILSDVGDVPVLGLQVNDLDLETVLDLLQTAAGESVRWSLQGDVVVFTAYEFLPRRLDVRIYPVATLVAPRTTFRAPPAGLLGGSDGRHVAEDYSLYGTIDELIELVMNTVHPEFWEETEGADVRGLDETRAVVHATPAVHAALLAFLHRLENRGLDAFRVEVHALAASRLEGFDLEANGAVDDEVATALLAGADAGPSFSLAVRNGVSSTAFAGSRRAYVAGYEPRFGGGTATQDPLVETQEQGLAVQVQAVGGDDPGHILLKLGVAIATGQEGAPARTDTEPAIELPAAVTLRRDSTLLVAPGRWHLAEGRTGGTDVGGTAFLVRVTPVEPDEGAPAAATPFVMPAAVPTKAKAEVSDVRIARIQWEQVDLDQIVAWLRATSGLDFFVTPRVRAEIFEEIEVSLDLTDVSLGTVLDLVTGPYELAWTVRDGLVVIDMRDDRGSRMALRYYDVRDLVEGVVSLGSGLLRVRGADPGHAGEEVPLYVGERLVDLIRDTLGTEDDWEDPALIEVRSDILIARNEPRILEALQRILDGLRASTSVVVTTVELLEIAPATARALFEADAAAGCPVLLEPAWLERLEAAVARGEAARLDRERSISVQGSGTRKATGASIRYVSDYDVRTTEDAISPVRHVATLHSGATIGVRTAPGHPGSSVYLEVAYERSVLVEMVPFRTVHGPIDLPLTDVWRVATGLRVPDGRTALVCAGRDGDRVRLLLVTPRRLTLLD